LINSPNDIDLRVAIRTEFQRIGLGEILAGKNKANKNTN